MNGWCYWLWFVGYVGRIGLEVYRAVLALVLKLFLSMNTCTRGVAIGKRMGSTLKKIVNTGMIRGKGSAGNAVASLSNGFALAIPRKTALIISFVKCGARRMTTTPSMVVALRSSTRLLNRIIMVNCNATGGGSLAKSIATVDTSGVMGNTIASTASVLINGTTNMDIVASNNTPKTNTAVHIHNNSSVSTSGGPLVIVSNIPMSSNNVGNVSGPLTAIRPGSVRAFAVLGSTSTATVCNSHTSGNIVVVGAGGKGSKHMRINCDNAFSVGAEPGGMSMVSTGRFERFIASGFNRSDTRFGTLNRTGAS